MKMIRCYKCKQEFEDEDTREVSWDTATGTISVDLCEECSDDFDKFVGKCMTAFFNGKKVSFK